MSKNVWTSNGWIGPENKLQKKKKSHTQKKNKLSFIVRASLFSFHHYSAKQSISRGLACLIENINPFYSFPDFHFVKFITGVKIASICF